MIAYNCCRLATAYDREITMVDLATNPASRPQSRVSIKTNMTSTTMLTKYEEDSIMYIKSENQALKMELRYGIQYVTVIVDDKIYSAIQNMTSWNSSLLNNNCILLIFPSM